MMMVLGLYVFMLRTVPYQDLSAQLNNLQDTATSALSDISKTVGGLLS